MEVKINKEVRDYTESIFFGLTIRQCLFSIIACIVAVIIYYSFYDTFSIEIISWLCILGALPFALLGFITFQSMLAEDIVRHLIYSLILQRRELLDSPYNLYHEVYRNIIYKYIKEEKLKC